MDQATIERLLEHLRAMGLMYAGAASRMLGEPLPDKLVVHARYNDPALS